jgi:hypothetical protein
MLSVFYAQCNSYVHYAECRYAYCRYAECHYAECRYAECRYAECRGAKVKTFIFFTSEKLGAIKKRCLYNKAFRCRNSYQPTIS